jgi:glycosyltransferase involved in cell wall biosynthesis
LGYALSSVSLGIGIPTKNQADYLAAAIESVLNQTHAATEIVVSDNHSTDNTAAVLAGFRDRVTVISPPSPLGGLAHFNFVAAHLKSEWMTLLGSDDVAKPELVETLLRGARQANDAVIIRAGYERIDGAGNVLGRALIRSVRRIARWPDTILEQLEGPRVNLGASAIRKSVWEDVGGFPERINLHGDWVFCLRMAPMGAFVYEPSTVMQKRFGYRPGLDRRRLLEELENDYVIATEIFPEIKNSLGPSYAPRIERAQRRVLKRRVAHASAVLGQDTRRDAAQVVHAWASAVGCTEVALAFESGAHIRRPSQVASKLRNAPAFLRQLTWGRRSAPVPSRSGCQRNGATGAT